MLDDGCPERLLFQNLPDWSHLHSQLNVGYHGTSLYVLQRVLAEGLKNGWAVSWSDDREHRGVFYMRPQEAACCANYMLYNQLIDQDGWLYATLLESSTDLRKRRAAGLSLGKLRRKKGTHQHTCDESECRINAVYIHQVHVLQVLGSPAEHSIWAEGSFLDYLEIDPYQQWGDIVFASKNSQLQLRVPE